MGSEYTVEKINNMSETELLGIDKSKIASDAKPVYDQRIQEIEANKAHGQTKENKNPASD